MSTLARAPRSLRASSTMTATAPFMSAAPSPCTAPPSWRPGRLPWAGTVSRWPASSSSGRSRRAVTPARTHVSPAARASTPPSRSSPSTRSASAASPRDSDGTSTSSSVRAASRSPRPSDAGTRRHATAMRYCGIDVSARRSHQQLVTLHERRAARPDAPAGEVELVATFYDPGPVDAVARTVLGFGGEAVVAVDAPSGRRLDLLAAGSPLRDALGLPAGRYERSRVCDAILFRRGLPLYPVPAATQALRAWEEWIEVGWDVFAALDGLGLFRPDAR